MKRTDDDKLRKQVNEITNLRAIAILLVVVGHSIILYSKWTRYTTVNEVYVLERLKDWINLIQMPLYFSISGFLFYISRKRRFVDLVRTKAKRILIPWAIVSMGWMIPIRMLVNYAGYRHERLFNIIVNHILLGRNDGHMWFLLCLFICFMIAYLYDAVIENLRVNELAGRMGMLLLAYILLRKEYLFPKIGIIRDPSKYLFYFEVGYLISMLWNRFEKNRMTHIVGWILFSINTAAGMIMPTNSASPFLVIVKVLLVVSFYLMMPQTTCGYAELLSSYSYGLYLFHSPLIYITYTFIPDAQPAIVVSTNLFVFGAVAFMMTRLLKKSPFRLIIGEM